MILFKLFISIEWDTNLEPISWQIWYNLCRQMRWPWHNFFFIWRKA